VALSCTFETLTCVGSNTIACKLMGEEQRPLTGARISLQGDMSHPGMGPVFGEAKETSPGTYTGMLDLNMRGDWVVTAHIVLSDGKTLDQEMKIENLHAN